MPNDGCPAAGIVAETPTQCVDAFDHDGDGRVNDGCASQAEPELQCGGDTVDDDEDGLVNDGCPLMTDCSSTIPGGDGTQPCGMGAYQITIQWDASRLAYVGHQQGAWLTTSGRTLSANPCPFVVGANQLVFSCSTDGTLPLGVEGGGTLLTVTFDPLAAVGVTTQVTMTSQLADIRGRVLAHTDSNTNVTFRRCADVSGNGAVSLQDVGQVLAKVGTTGGPPPSSGWDPKFDLNQNNAVTLSDVGYALAQVGQSCVFIP
jgi:hypothetical protein